MSLARLWHSLPVIAVFALAAIGLIWLFREEPGSRESGLTRSRHRSRLGCNARSPRRNSPTGGGGGNHFVHVNGAYGEKRSGNDGRWRRLPDFDNDGDQDLLFVNSSPWPWKASDNKKPATMGLYRNDGTGRYQDVTAGSGLDISLYGMGAAIGDYDNDGFVDVFVTAVGENRLFHNEGNGKFADVTAQAGVGGSPTEWSASAAWLDFDNDGDLDLFVCNYVQWSREIDLKVDYRFAGIGRAYGPPTDFAGTFPYLFRNDGKGRFTDVSQPSGVQVTNRATGLPMAKSLGVAPVDINGDHWIDLVVANDTVQNFVFSNRWDGTFQEVGAHSGIAFDSYGQTRGAMGIDAARFRNDDALGIAIGNFANEMNALYVSQRDALVFADEAITEASAPAGSCSSSVCFLRLHWTGGWMCHGERASRGRDRKVQAGQRCRQPAQLFWNSGSSRGFRFVPVPARMRPGPFKPMVGRDRPR